MLTRMLPIDSLQLAARQFARDRKHVKLLPGLHERKQARMQASPLAFLRGTAPLFYELLRDRPALAKGPAGEGWIAGDLHLENFGAFRPDEHSFDENTAVRAVFNLNDFDDCIIGPWRFDVLRLTTSLLLGARQLKVTGTKAMDLAHVLLDAYLSTAFHNHPAGIPPPVVAKLVEQVQSRSQNELLDARTEVVKGNRRFILGERYRPLSKVLKSQARTAFARYVHSLSEDDNHHEEAFEVLDLAFRVAGTGSLGCLRIAILVRGKDPKDGAWLFDMKEEGVPSPALILPKPKLPPAERVATGLRSCLQHPPRMLGTTRLTGKSMFVRRLAPQEDKLDLTQIHGDDCSDLARYLGALAGAAHRRGVTRAPAKAWTGKDCELLVDNAVILAGVHEAAYLAYCRHTTR